MGEVQTPSDEMAQAELRAFEVGIGKLCEEIKTPYDHLSKLANDRFKFAQKPEEAPALLAPWLVDQIVAAATAQEETAAAQQKQG